MIFYLILYSRELHFSDSMQAADHDPPADARGEIVDLMTGKVMGKPGKLVSLFLQPYEFFWLLIP